jgi:hypothetical protein
MRCQDAQRLMLDGLERKMNEDSLFALEDHVRRCPGCAGFRADLKGIRAGLENRTLPEPPADVIERTRALCLAELRANEDASETNPDKTRTAALPGFIQAALAVLTTLTLVFVVPRIEDIKLDETLTFETALTFVLLIQNAFMLFFAPVLIRKFRSNAERQESE